MNATQKLHEVGQSLWLDNITRDLLDSGTLKRYIDELSVTGLTSNPTIFDNAIKKGSSYDATIRKRADAGAEPEQIFFDLALEDLTRAADLFLPIHQKTDGVDGFVSLEVSPLLAYDTQKTVEQAKDLHDKAGKPNLFIKIPGTPEGLPAIEESIYHGIPINVTLLFSREQYLACAEAYMRGIERRISEGKSPVVESVASVFVSRWDKAIQDKVSDDLRGKLGIATSLQTYKAYVDLLASERWQKLAAAGAHPQRLLWASTSVKDKAFPDTLYVKTLAAPNTVDTMPEETLLAFGDHGEVDDLLPTDGGDSDATLKKFADASVDIAAVAEQLQKDGAKSFVESWNNLIGQIESKSKALTGAAA